MTHPPDPQLALGMGDWIAAGAYALFLLWRRRKQNDKLGDTITAATQSEVDAIHEELKAIQSAKEADQTRSAIMTNRMDHLEIRVQALIQRLDKFESALPQATDVLEKVLNVLERLKAGTLVEKPIEGSGGMVALKKKEEKS